MWLYRIINVTIRYRKSTMFSSAVDMGVLLLSLLILTWQRRRTELRVDCRLFGAAGFFLESSSGGEASARMKQLTPDRDRGVSGADNGRGSASDGWTDFARILCAAVAMRRRLLGRSVRHLAHAEDASTPAAHFMIRAFQVKGNQWLAAREVEDLVSSLYGADRTADDVEKARAALQKAFEARGYARPSRR